MWFYMLCFSFWLITKTFVNNEPPHDKTNKMTVLPVKTQISIGIRQIWSESSLCAQWVAKDPSFLHADIEDSDQPQSLLGAHAILLVLSWGSSNIGLYGPANQTSFKLPHLISWTVVSLYKVVD